MIKNAKKLKSLWPYVSIKKSPSHEGQIFFRKGWTNRVLFIILQALPLVGLL